MYSTSVKHTNSLLDKSQTNKMATQVINELKDIYRQHLHTELGKKNIKKAIELKKEWENHLKMFSIQFDTKSVKPNIVPKFLSKKMTCIEITPIGLNNMCHITSNLLADKHEDVKSVLGYNLSACPCGRMMCMELHSVNKIGDKFYDFTRDYNYENSKWFIELDTELKSIEYINLFGRGSIWIDKTCKCKNVKWNKQYVMNDNDIEEQINFIETRKMVYTEYGCVIVTK
jgi:hypothetical protein